MCKNSLTQYSKELQDYLCFFSTGCEYLKQGFMVCKKYIRNRLHLGSNPNCNPLNSFSYGW
jgi:hypothetical protein